MSIAIAANNPFRPADWRWQRAREIEAGTGLPTTKRRDGLAGYKWIKRACKFLSQLSSCTHEWERTAVAEQHPGIFWAHYAWSSMTNPQKHSIEAHILARGDNAFISEYCGVSPDIVEAYEALFFNVREKLENKGYILHCVIGPAIQRGLSEREFDLLWKLYGYFLGPHIVTALESKFANPVWCGTKEAVSAAVLDDAIGTLKLKAALAAKTVNVNQHTQLALMDQFTKFVEVERSTDTAGKSQEQILEHISVMMTQLPFNVGGRDPRSGNKILTVAEGFEQSPIELTYEETLKSAADQPIMHANILRRLAFPVTPSTQVLEAPK